MVEILHRRIEIILDASREKAFHLEGYVIRESEYSYLIYEIHANRVMEIPKARIYRSIFYLEDRIPEELLKKIEERGGVRE